MKTLQCIGFFYALSIMTFGWSPVAMSEAVSPQAPQDARDLSEYVYLHVTRNQSISMQGATRASTCRGTSRGVRS